MRTCILGFPFGSFLVVTSLLLPVASALAKRVVLVTGANKGIGKEIARQLGEAFAGEATVIFGKRKQRALTHSLPWHSAKHFLPVCTCSAISSCHLLTPWGPKHGSCPLRLRASTPVMSFGPLTRRPPLLLIPPTTSKVPADVTQWYRLVCATRLPSFPARQQETHQ